MNRPGALAFPFGDTPPITMDARQKHGAAANLGVFDEDATFGLGMHGYDPAAASKRRQFHYPFSPPSTVYRTINDVLNGRCAFVVLPCLYCFHMKDSAFGFLSLIPQCALVFTPSDYLWLFL